MALLLLHREDGQDHPGSGWCLEDLSKDHIHWWEMNSWGIYQQKLTQDIRSNHPLIHWRAIPWLDKDQQLEEPEVLPKLVQEKTCQV